MANTRDITKQLFKHHNVSFDSEAFKAYWEKNICIVAQEDLDYTFADACGDTYNPAANPDIDPAQLKKEQIAFKRRFNKERVWGVGLSISGKPDYSTFIWGFVGDDFTGSGYDVELIEQMAELYNKANEDK